MMKLIVTVAMSIAIISSAEARMKKYFTDPNGNEAYCLRSGGSTSLVPVVEPLKSKVQEIIRDCGSVVVSTGCRGGVTPNHREWKAVDIKGNPKCIYAHLKDWPGGVSTDYSRVKHVHISYSRKHEWGLRFAHYTPRHKARSQIAHARTHTETISFRNFSAY